MLHQENKLGNVIKHARQSKHLTQMELSEELDISPRHLQAIENEGKTPSFDLFCRMLPYLELSADDILSDAPNDLSVEQNRLIYLIRHQYSPELASALLTMAQFLNDYIKSHS